MRDSVQAIIASSSVIHSMERTLEWFFKNVKKEQSFRDIKSRVSDVRI